MNSKKEIIITPHEIKGKQSLYKKIVVKNDEKVLVTGKVIDELENPIADVMIKIEKIIFNNKPFRNETIGYIYTDNCGNYSVLLDKQIGVKYMFIVFNKLI